MIEITLTVRINTLDPYKVWYRGLFRYRIVPIGPGERTYGFYNTMENFRISLERSRRFRKEINKEPNG